MTHSTKHYKHFTHQLVEELDKYQMRSTLISVTLIKYLSPPIIHIHLSYKIKSSFCITLIILVIHTNSLMALRSLPPQLQAKAQAELYEDPVTVQVDLEYIKDWLKHKKKIEIRTDSQWRLSFLRGCKFDHERMKEKLDAYCNLRKLEPELFLNRDPFSSEIRAILNLGLFLPLLKAEDPVSPKIILIRLGEFNPSVVHISNILKLSLMICEILLNEDDQFVVCGAVFLFDMKGVTQNHLDALNPNNASSWISVLQKAYPIRTKAFHYINIPRNFKATFDLIKLNFKKKLLQNMVIHRSEKSEEIFKIAPKSILPIEYGGEAKTIQDLRRHWQTKVESYREWFEQDPSLGKNKTKKVGEPKGSCTVL